MYARKLRDGSRRKIKSKKTGLLPYHEHQGSKKKPAYRNGTKKEYDEAKQKQKQKSKRKSEDTETRRGANGNTKERGEKLARDSGGVDWCMRLHTKRTVVLPKRNPTKTKK